MPSGADMEARHGAMLAKIAEVCLAAACDLQQQLAASESAQDSAHYAMGLNRMARSVRQSVALEAKLARDADAAAREDAKRQQAAQAAADWERRNAAAAAATPVDRHRDRVAVLLERCIEDEAEALDEDEDWVERKTSRLTELLNDDIFDPRFLDVPVEQHVARLCADLGIDPPKPRAAWPAPAPAETPSADADLAALSYAPP